MPIDLERFAAGLYGRDAVDKFDRNRSLGRSGNPEFQNLDAATIRELARKEKNQREAIAAAEKAVQDKRDADRAALVRSQNAQAFGVGESVIEGGFLPQHITTQRDAATNSDRDRDSFFRQQGKAQAAAGNAAGLGLSGIDVNAPGNENLQYADSAVLSRLPNGNGGGAAAAAAEDAAAINFYQNQLGLTPESAQAARSQGISPEGIFDLNKKFEDRNIKIESSKLYLQTLGQHAENYIAQSIKDGNLDPKFYHLAKKPGSEYSSSELAAVVHNLGDKTPLYVQGFTPVNAKSTIQGLTEDITDARAHAPLRQQPAPFQFADPAAAQQGQAAPQAAPADQFGIQDAFGAGAAPQQGGESEALLEAAAASQQGGGAPQEGVVQPEVQPEVQQNEALAAAEAAASQQAPLEDPRSFRPEYESPSAHETRKLIDVVAAEPIVVPGTGAQTPAQRFAELTSNDRRPRDHNAVRARRGEGGVESPTSNFRARGARGESSLPGTEAQAAAESLAEPTRNPDKGLIAGLRTGSRGGNIRADVNIEQGHQFYKGITDKKESLTGHNRDVFGRGVETIMLLLDEEAKDDGGGFLYGTGKVLGELIPSIKEQIFSPFTASAAQISIEGTARRIMKENEGRRVAGLPPLTKEQMETLFPSDDELSAIILGSAGLELASVATGGIGARFVTKRILKSIAAGSAGAGLYSGSEAGATAALAGDAPADVAKQAAVATAVGVGLGGGVAGTGDVAARVIGRALRRRGGNKGSQSRADTDAANEKRTRDAEQSEAQRAAQEAADADKLKEQEGLKTKYDEDTEKLKEKLAADEKKEKLANEQGLKDLEDKKGYPTETEATAAAAAAASEIPEGAPPPPKPKPKPKPKPVVAAPPPPKAKPKPAVVAPPPPKLSVAQAAAQAAAGRRREGGQSNKEVGEDFVRMIVDREAKIPTAKAFIETIRNQNRTPESMHEAFTNQREVYNHAANESERIGQTGLRDAFKKMAGIVGDEADSLGVKPPKPPKPPKAKPTPPLEPKQTPAQLAAAAAAVEPPKAKPLTPAQKKRQAESRKRERDAEKAEPQLTPAQLAAETAAGAPKSAVPVGAPQAPVVGAKPPKPPKVQKIQTKPPPRKGAIREEVDKFVEGKKSERQITYEQAVEAVRAKPRKSQAGDREEFNQGIPTKGDEKRRVGFKYAVISADNLITSDQKGYGPFAKLQNRGEVGGVVNQGIVGNIAGKNFEPTLIASRDNNLQTGAPIVYDVGGGKFIVLAGNHRTAALRHIFAEGVRGKNFYKYAEALEKAGFDDLVKATGGTKLSLVRVIDDDLDPGELKALSDLANEAQTASHRPDVASGNIGEKILEDVRARREASAGIGIEFDLKNKDGRKAFLDAVGPQEAQRYRGESSVLNDEGENRFRKVLVSIALGDRDDQNTNALMKIVSGDAEDKIKGAINAIADAAGPLAGLKEAIDDGLIQSTFDLSEALRIVPFDINESRKHKISPQEFYANEKALKTGSAKNSDGDTVQSLGITEEFFDMQEALWKVFFRENQDGSLGGARSATKSTGILKAYVDEVFDNPDSYNPNKKGTQQTFGGAEFKDERFGPELLKTITREVDEIETQDSRGLGLGDDPPNP